MKDIAEVSIATVLGLSTDRLIINRQKIYNWSFGIINY